MKDDEEVVFIKGMGRDPFVIIDRDAMDDHKLSWSAKGLLPCITHLCQQNSDDYFNNHPDDCYPYVENQRRCSLNDLKKVCPKEEGEVAEYLDELVKRGYVVSEDGFFFDWLSYNQHKLAMKEWEANEQARGKNRR